MSVSIVFRATGVDGQIDEGAREQLIHSTGPMHEGLEDVTEDMVDALGHGASGHGHGMHAFGGVGAIAFQGRGAQEGVFAELKTHCQMGHVPVITRLGNQLYMYSAILAHNITRELLMLTAPPERATTAKRAALWTFQHLDTLRRSIIQRA